MARDREKTSNKIKQAAVRLLLSEGFSAWGINSVARGAGVDKVLIYRYFDSLSGLLQAIVTTTRFWPDPASLDAASGEAFIAETISALEVNPLWQILYGLPTGNECRAQVDARSAADLKEWLNEIRIRCSGSVTESELLQLPALIQFHTTNPLERLSAADIWATVSPPLLWEAGDDFQPYEELPTELL